jgi:tRNA threonylcarbamoyladenosine biosynthesis protein TsaB
MIVLAIDTATDTVSVALHDGEGVVASSVARGERRHAELLAPMIGEVIERAGITLADVGTIAVDVGPGLFTGMRVGITSAKAMAEVLDVPVVPITSLDALAAGAESTEMEVVACVLDARRGEVYWGLYRADDRTRLTEARVGSPESCIADIAARGQSVAVVGSGMTRYREVFAEQLRLAVPAHALGGPDEPLAETVAALGHVRAMRQLTCGVDEVVPLYLRAPDAEINWATRSSS